MLVATIIESIPVPPTTSLSLVMAFEHDASQVGHEAQLVLSKYKKQGVGLLVHAQHEVDLQKLGDFNVRFESVNGEAIGGEAGERQSRFTIRPAYSACTELVAIAPVQPAVQSASALQALQQKPASPQAVLPAPKPVAPPAPAVQEKKPLFSLFGAKKPEEKKEEKKPEAKPVAAKPVAPAQTPAESAGEMPFAVEKI